MKHFTLVAIHTTAIALLASCTTSIYNTTAPFQLHKGDKVTMTNKCMHHNYFERICKPAVGVVTDYYDGKSRCYPHLAYTVQFNVDGAPVSVRLCASDVEKVSRLK